MSLRWLVLVSCATPTASEVVIERIDPAAATSAAPVPVRIGGTFHVPVTTSLQTGAIAVGATSADLEGTSLDGAWQDEHLIVGTVPAGLAPGTYDVRVNVGGASATLPDGYTVIDDTPPPPPAPFALSGVDWLLPCLQNATPNMYACTCASGVLTTSRTIGGNPGERWHVTVRIRGVLEYMTYSGGSGGPVGWYVGGTPGGGNNWYMLQVSSPAARYYINHSANAAQNNSWLLDYTATFDVDAGATLTFSSSGSDSIQWEGVNAMDQPISVPGITDPAQPYNGQFAQLDVVMAEPF